MNKSKPVKINRQKNADGTELESASPHIIVELIEYENNSVVSKSIIKKPTGSVSAISFDEGEGLNEKISPFNTFIQIIDGTAEIVIEAKSNNLKTGDGIIIPAHVSSYIKPNGRFKMLVTIIKSGYE